MTCRSSTGDCINSRVCNELGRCMYFEPVAIIPKANRFCKPVIWNTMVEEPKGLPVRSDNAFDNAMYWSIIINDKAGYFFRNEDVARANALEELQRSFQYRKIMYDKEIIHRLHKKQPLIFMNKWAERFSEKK